MKLASSSSNISSSEDTNDPSVTVPLLKENPIVSKSIRKLSGSNIGTSSFFFFILVFSEIKKKLTKHLVARRKVGVPMPLSASERAKEDEEEKKRKDKEKILQIIPLRV